MNHNSVLSPTIEEDAAKSLYDFIQDLNDGILNAHAKGYLHGGLGAKIRLEPIEQFETRDTIQWKKMAARRGLEVTNVRANLTSGHADLIVEYKPGKVNIMREWKNLIWPALVLVALMKYMLPYLT